MVDARRRRATTLLWGAAGLVTVTLVGLAAGVGSPVATSPMPRPFWANDSTATPEPQASLPEGGGDASLGWLNVLLRIVLALCVLALVAAVIVFVVQLFKEGRGLILRRVLEPDELEMLTIPLSEGPLLVRQAAVQDALDASRVALAAGSDVRAAIIAAWLRLERTAADVGAPPQRTDTSTDLVERLLTHPPVAAADLARLAAVYRRARFSPETLTERDRDDALAALDAVRTSLGRTGADTTVAAERSAGSAAAGGLGPPTGVVGRAERAKGWR